MHNWQTVLSLLIVAAAVIQLIRLLTVKKSKCGSCTDRCYSQKNKKDSLVQLEDLAPAEKVQS